VRFSKRNNISAVYLMFTKDTEVTAVSTFKGRPEERELSFDYGDLIKIISLVPKVSLR